jgi:glycosyltransferase involved in cell wall biosynthesis
MNIWILNHYAHPPDIPGSTRHYDFARELIKQGHKVTIFSSSFNHFTRRDDKLSGKQYYRMENADGVVFVWLRTSPYYGGNDWHRVVNMLSYSLRVIPRGLKLKEKPDVIMASSPHPFAGLSGWFLAKLKGAAFIFEVMDLWPQVFVDIAGYSEKSLVVRILRIMESFLYHRASKIIVLQPLATDYIKRLDVPETKLVYIPIGTNPYLSANGANEFASELQDTISKLKLDGKVLVGYTGAHGIHDSLHTILETAKLLQDRGQDSIHFLLIGSGADKSRVVSYASSNRLHNISFFEPVPKHAMPRLLRQIDIAIMCRHKTDLYSKYGVSTNKLWDYMMAARPVVWAINSANDPVAEAGCGITAPPEDPLAMAEAILRLYGMSQEERQLMGMRGHDYVLRYHSIPLLADRLIQVIRDAATK